MGGLDVASCRDREMEDARKEFPDVLERISNEKLAKGIGTLKELENLP